MCPPVPPPAISNRIVVPRSLLDGLARDRQQDTDGREADDERRAAGADERQRDAGDREERDDDPDVDERLDAEPAGDARREQRPERVRGAERDADARSTRGRGTARSRRAPPRARTPAPISAKTKSLNALGRQPPAWLSPRPVAEHAAEPEREQALDRVEADRRAGPTRVEPGADAVHLVAVRARRRSPRATAAGDEGREVHEVGAGDEEHRERGQGDDARRAEVRLREARAR